MQVFRSWVNRVPPSRVHSALWPLLLLPLVRIPPLRYRRIGNDNSDAKDLCREVQIMHYLTGHRNIVELHGSYEDLAMELYEGGESVLPLLPARLGKLAEEDVQAWRRVGRRRRGTAPATPPAGGA